MRHCLILQKSSQSPLSIKMAANYMSVITELLPADALRAKVLRAQASVTSAESTFLLVDMGSTVASWLGSGTRLVVETGSLVPKMSLPWYQPSPLQQTPQPTSLPSREESFTRLPTFIHSLLALNVHSIFLHPI